MQVRVSSNELAICFFERELVQGHRIRPGFLLNFAFSSTDKLTFFEASVEETEVDLLTRGGV